MITNGDPVVALLEQYRASEKEYNDCPESDRAKLVELRDRHTKVMDEITSSTLAAASITGALAAIRAGLDEEKLMTSNRTLTIALLEMGLAYFDGLQPVDNGGN